MTRVAVITADEARMAWRAEQNERVYVNNTRSCLLLRTLGHWWSKQVCI